MKGLVTSPPSPSPSPSPSLFFFSQHPSNNSSPQFLQLKSRQQQQRLSSLIFQSSSTSSPIVEEQPDDLPLNFSGCKGCGREEIEKGCNSEGRIQGGIATFPGFGWWPIKAYRPCPGFLASGGNYRRQGQSMDEVAFGGGKTMDD